MGLGDSPSGGPVDASDRTSRRPERSRRDTKGSLSLPSPSDSPRRPSSLVLVRPWCSLSGPVGSLPVGASPLGGVRRGGRCGVGALRARGAAVAPTGRCTSVRILCAVWSESAVRNYCGYWMRLSLRSRRVCSALRAALIRHALPRDLLVLCGSSGPCDTHCVRQCWPWGCGYSYFAHRNSRRPLGLRNSQCSASRSRRGVGASARASHIATLRVPAHFTEHPSRRPRRWIGEPRVSPLRGRFPTARCMRYALVMLRETRYAAWTVQDGMDGVLATRLVARNAVIVAQGAFSPLAGRLLDVARCEARSASCRAQPDAKYEVRVIAQRDEARSASLRE